jgi:DNA polymerase-3 subunit delta
MAAKAKSTGQTSPKRSAAPVIAISGEDGYLADKHCRALLDGLLKPEERMMALLAPAEDEMAALSIAEVLDELRTLPLMASRRVVLLRNADKFVRDNREALEKYLESPSPCGVLILQVSKLDSRRKLTKRLGEMGGLIDAGVKKAWELPKFIVELSRSELGKTIDTQAAALLVDLVGEETGRIRQELEKLAVYVGERTAITSRHVHELVGGSRADGAFEVIDAIFEKPPQKVFQKLRNMFGQDADTQYTVIGAFAYHFRKMFLAKALLAKGVAAGQAAKQAGVFGNRQSQFFAQLQRFSLSQLGRILLRLGEMDYEIKTGRTTAPSAMERLIVQIISGNL